MHNLLFQVIEQKKKDLISQMKKTEVEVLQITTPRFPSRKNLFKHSISQAENLGLIAEIKLASPTNGILGTKDELLERAKNYAAAGATAISIITEKRFFKGDINFIQQVKGVVKIPVLQKDFIIDAYQIYEAKSIGSDAILLIARILDAKALNSFVKLAKKLGIEPIVEIHTDEDLEKAQKAKPAIIAVNARDLETGEISIAKACKILKKIPLKYMTLGFSGIHSAKEVLQYKKVGTQGVLVGTSLMRAKNIFKFIKEL